jgi:hypothetical protein
VAVALAARAALRVLPVIWEAQGRGSKGNFFTDIVMPVFRANCVAWASAKYPAEGTSVLAYATAATEAATTAAAQVNDHVRNAVEAAAEVAGAVATIEVTLPIATAIAAAKTVGYAVEAAYAGTGLSRGSTLDFGTAFDAVTDADAVFWSAVSADTRREEEVGRSASDIAGLLLWPLHPNGPEPLMSLWHEMEAALLAEKQDWMVWTIWYRDRLAGYVREEERELAYVRIDDELWAQGPAIVNAEIKRRIEALEPPSPPIEAIPKQEPIATRFGVNSQGLIDVVPDPPAPGTAANALQRESYEETCFKAQALVALGPNQLADLSGSVERFREALKERIEDISITSLWSRGNTLRSRLKAHDLSLNSAEPDPGRLPLLVAETLRDLIHTWNIFIVGDPKGRELDEIRLGPQDLQAAKELIYLAAPIIEALKQSNNVATESAKQATAEQAKAAKEALADINGAQAIDLSQKTIRNFVIELIRSTYQRIRSARRFARKEIVAGALRKIGADAVDGAEPQFVAFIVHISDALKNYVAHAWPDHALNQIIDLILRAVKS